MGVAASTNVVEHMSVIWRDTIQLQKRNSTNLQFLCDTNRNVFHKTGVNLKYYFHLFAHVLAKCLCECGTLNKAHINLPLVQG